MTAPTTIAAAELASASNSSVAQSLAAKNDAVLILAVSPSQGAGYVFRSVNLATGSFNATPSVRLSYDFMGFGDQMKDDARSNGSSNAAASPADSNILLLMASVPAGDYAVTEVSFGNLDTCLDDSAVVVRVRPHEITIVSSGDVLPPSVSGPFGMDFPVLGRLATNIDRARIARAFNSARMNYPSLVGEPANAEIVASIHWPLHFSWGNRCNSSDQFSTVRDMTVDTSAARAAALEEAQKNLRRAKGATVTSGAEESAPPPTMEKK